MAEQLDLTAPVTKTATANYRVSYLNMDVDGGRLMVVLTANNGDTVQKVYDATTTPTGASLLIALNKADLTAKSLQRRILERLIADGVIAGTISGVPA
jgi:hypothetical protein